MTIPAKARLNMVRLIRMTGIANLSFGHRPLMRNMTNRTVRRRMCRLEMEFRAIGMARNARREWFYLLLLQMTRGTRKHSHWSSRWARMTGSAFRRHPPAAPVALIAAELRMLSQQRPWVIELFRRPQPTITSRMKERFLVFSVTRKLSQSVSKGSG